MPLFHAQHMLTQGSLHYCLATLGYQNATPTALKHIYCNTISVVTCGKKWQIMYLFTANHFTLIYQ